MRKFETHPGARGHRGSSRTPLCATALALLLTTLPASAQPASPPPPDCAATAAERAALQAEHAAVKSTITDIAFGRTKKRKKIGAGQIGRAAASTAASILLPFGIGMAANAAVTAAEHAAKKGNKPAPLPPGPDVPALIDRQAAIEARLAELGACPPAPAASSTHPPAAR